MRNRKQNVVVSHDARRYTAINYLRGSEEGRSWLSNRSIMRTPDQKIIFKMYELKAIRDAKAQLKKLW